MSTPDPIALLCLPFAGAGASFYRPWAAHAGAELSIVPLQLPGRERLIDETPYDNVAAATDGLLAQTRKLLGDRRRVALFGHSLGAVLAFELARKLVAEQGIDVVRLFASGSPEPADQRQHRATGLSDEDFLTRVEEFAGYRHAALEDPEMREMILPTLRADVAMHENYQPLADTPLDVPITAVRGLDDTLVTTEEAAGWGKATSREFDLVELPGGHMYLTASAPDLLGRVRAAVR
ncbi:MULTISPECIES: thioesterase II family protein [unclassified Crossiella]|uniref:thioesterase II family protein n=1 Tax=unclassified Crossiella TaxID=2620835 RepID=UPI001FFE49CF|nr:MULTISPECIES: alpha/beta fold hydrolase [unclassified Crossiella]MCK2244592.1 alpha/beta fold hydrolase [Crossiella sp. S99.2]MCK2258223.1 alpha/beta fold hydrolase [Crossiella sp. S99.1]